MSAPFYKVSILTFSPCGGFFPHPTTERRPGMRDKDSGKKSQWPCRGRREGGGGDRPEMIKQRILRVGNSIIAPCDNPCEILLEVFTEFYTKETI